MIMAALLATRMCATDVGMPSEDGDGRKTRSKSVFVKPGARGSRRVGASESTRNTEPDIAALTEGVVPG